MRIEAPHLTRRQFGLCLGGIPLAFARGSAEDWASGMPWNQPANIAHVYLAGTPHWPKPNLDFQHEIQEVEARLSEVTRPNSRYVRLKGGELLRSGEEVRPWLDKMGDVDGVLMIPLSQPTPPLAAMMEELRVPALFFSRPYATHAWGSIGGYRRSGKRVDVIATSNFGDLEPYLRMFQTVAHLKRSKVLVGCTEPGRRQDLADSFQERFGTSFRFVTGDEFAEAFRSIDDKLAREAAEQFVNGALRVVEPTPAEIHDGLRFYLALGEMLKREKANALTIDCFGTLAASTLPGYPCIAWSKFNDAGLYGVCEADLDSTMTQMLVTSYARVPGFVSDPVFDTSRNEVVHAHCVSATKMKGIDGPSYPYIVRNHLETDEGAVVQVLMPSDETITVARFVGPTKLLLSTAEVIGPVDSDRGCRSQIRTRVSDAEKWLQGYSAGLHRVIFYGDHVRTIQRMGRLMGFEVVQEM